LLIADLGFVDPRDAVEDIDLLVDAGPELGALEEDLDQLGPLVLLRVDRVEAIARGRVAGVGRAHALVDGGGARQVLDLLLPGRTGLQQGLAALDLVVEDERALLEDIDRLFPAALADEQAFEGAERAEVAGVDRGDAAPGIDGVVDAAEHVALELP